MKFFGLLVLSVCLGASSAGFINKISETHNAVRSAATNAVKTVATAQVDLAKTVVNAQVNLTKTAVSTASNVARNTVNTAKNVVQALSTGAVNTGISFLIAQMRWLVKATGKSNITIPDVNTKTGPVTLNATDGFFSDISSISQAGKANVTVNGTSLVIDIPLKLDEIKTGYKKFNISMWKVQASGGLGVNIANDTFVVHLRLTPGFNCALNVEKVDVTVFGGITLDFTDMGKKSEYVMDKCSNTIVKFMKENIKKQVQTAIDTNLKKVLKQNGSICSKFLG